MPLNAEEKYEHEEFKSKQYTRPTDEQLKVAELERELAELNEQLALVRNTNDHINNELDKRVKQIDLINGACQQVLTDPEFGDGLFKDRILSILGWAR